MSSVNYNQPPENRRSSLPSMELSSTGLTSNEQLASVAEDQSQSALAPSIHSSSDLRKKDLSSLGGEMTPNEMQLVEPEGGITDLVIPDERPSNGLLSTSNSSEAGSLGEAGLAVRQHYSFTTHWIAKPASFLFLGREAGEAWLREIQACKKIFLDEGRPAWFLNTMDLLWTAHLAYEVLTNQVADVLGKK